jgi:zinc/manganese transport system substrate-binding protein
MRTLLLSILILLNSATVFAGQLHVVTTYPYIAGIVKHVGEDRVNVCALADGAWDPHTIVPKPSHIAKLRAAGLLIINGAQLEIGWLPPLMVQANNPRINVGSRGLLDLSRYVTLMDVPGDVSRAQGDVHPDGNPHYYLDPHNIPLLAHAIAERLGELDPGNRDYYAGNSQAFAEKWEVELAGWTEEMRPVMGAVVIEYHRLFDYFLTRFGLRLLGTVERLPGIPPSSKHIAELETIITSTRVRFILQDVYHPDNASRHLSKRHGIRLVTLPHDVGAVPEAKDIFGLFDSIVEGVLHE